MGISTPLTYTRGLSIETRVLEPAMEMPTNETAIASNRDAWNDSARHHKNSPEWPALLEAVRHSDFSCIDDTLREVLEQVGVAGKDAVQVGCNNGRESLSLFALGARSVVGIDQSQPFSIRRGNSPSVHPTTRRSSKPTSITCPPNFTNNSTWR